MSLRRATLWMCVATLGVASSCPAIAQANPLLSGYGGPGQGSQAILGSQLLGGPSGGGGGPTAGAGEAASASTGASEQPDGDGGAAQAETVQGAARGGSAGHGGDANGGAQHDGERSPSGLTHTLAPQAASALGAGVFGLSDEDFLYAGLAILALALTGGVTALLMRRSPSG